MSSETPTAVSQFLEAEQQGDPQAIAACFGSDGVVLDEGRTRLAREEIADWRRQTAAAYEYPATVTAEQELVPDGFRVIKHLEGNFPGGVVDLEYLFALRDEPWPP